MSCHISPPLPFSRRRAIRRHLGGLHGGQCCVLPHVDPGRQPTLHSHGSLRPELAERWDAAPPLTGNHGDSADELTLLLLPPPLSEPEFVGSFSIPDTRSPDDDKVYFFFKERAAEAGQWDRRVYGRVARVCKVQTRRAAAASVTVSSLRVCRAQ